MTQTVYPASPKMVAFIHTLAEERQGGVMYVKTQLDAWKVPTVEEFSWTAAKNVIGVMLDFPRNKATEAKFAAATPGYYRAEDGTVFEVVKAKNSDRTYAKRLVLVNTSKTCGGCEHCDGENLCVVKKGRWEFVQGAMKKFSEWTALTLDEATEFGKKFGVCCVCGRTLTKTESVEAGIGPICAGKF